MKQLLLRVPDDVHRRLAARAERAGRSVNSIATEILDAAADADQPDRRARLRARAAALGILAVPAGESVPPPLDAQARRRLLESMGGVGRVLDSLLNEDRDRL